MTGKGGSPMLCTPSSLCSAELPYREEEDESEEASHQEQEDRERKKRRRGMKGVACDWKGGLPHAVHPQQPLQR